MGNGYLRGKDQPEDNIITDLICQLLPSKGARKLPLSKLKKEKLANLFIFDLK
jgi:hypothetical protein